MQPMVQVLSKSKVGDIEVEVFSNRVGQSLEYGYTLYKTILESRFSFDGEIKVCAPRRVCIGGSPAKYKTIPGAERAGRKEALPGSAASARAASVRI